MVGEPGVAHPCHPRVASEVLGHRLGVGHLPLQPHAQGLEALEDQEGVERGQRGPAVAQAHGPTPHDVGVVGELLGVDHAVEGGLGPVEHGEPLGVLGPWEPAAVDDHAPENGAVAADELGQRVDDHVGAVLYGLQKERRGDCVVDHQGHAPLVGGGAQGLQVDHVAGRVADALAEDGPGVLVDQFGDGMCAVVLGETGLDPLLGQAVGEQGVGGPVELRGGHDVGAGRGQVPDRLVDGRRPRAHRQGTHAALEGGHPLLEHVVGRVVDPVVMEARRLQVEDLAGPLGALELVGDGLVDGHGGRTGRLPVVAPVDG